jgi:FHS family Na+ dependent glucose MFS transporter 1
MTQSSPSLTSQPAVNPNRLWQTGAYYVAFIILGMVTASYGPALPYLALQTHSSLDQISSIFVFSSFGYLLGSLFSGRLYDRRKAHPILTLVLLVSAAGMVFIPFMPLLIPMILLFFVLGLGTGSVDVGGNTLLIWAHGTKVGPFMNGLHFFFGVGAFLAPILVAGAVNSTGSYSGAYWIIALLILPIAFAFTRIASPTNPAISSAVEEKPFSRLLVGLLILFFFLYVGAETGFGGWIFTYSTHLNLADETTAAYITSAFWGALTVGRLLGVPISTWLQPKTIIWVDLIGCLLGISLVVFFPLSSAVMWAGAILLGVSMASIFPTTLSLAEKRLHISGKVTSWFFVGSSLGSMVLPWVCGQLFVAFGPTAAMWLIFGDILLSIATFFFIK